ncbi:TolC family protein [Rhodanobacter sp. T12-5]|uniref:TolC family protein n=1 Tax=Rhodanobacter sp. T12-5 TaxID=2024611 RepID=UPI0018D99CD3|nr:TolC family protein [Rhodanobacter sp. T12-5]HTH67838.1 TolC family protein [Rhodanobacter sp.]
MHTTTILMPKKLLAATLATLVLGGCAIHPRPLTLEQRSATLQADQQAMFAEQTPVSGPITLDEAMARALKYNLDNRVKMMEEALAQRQLDLSNFDLLPKLTAAAGYTSRDNVLASSSQDIVTGQQSLVPSTSSERQATRADLGFSWNILDFGVSYYGARQQADRVLATQERRRKVVQLLMQQTRQAYWQAAGAQKLQAQIEPLLAQAQQALGDSRAIEQQGLKDPLQSLGYQRELLGLVLQLETIRDELAQAKPKLASIMNLEPGKPYQLAPPASFDTPELSIAPEKMEEVALLHRPELIEASYNERIGLDETHKAMAKLLPGVELNVGTHYDSNDFLVNNEWRDAGIQISWNLLNLLNAGHIKAAAKAQYELAREQRLALNMAVLTQVHVAYIDYTSRKQQFELTRQLSDVEQRILEHTRNATQANAQGKLAEIRAATSALMSELKLYQSYAAYQGAYGQMVATLGLDPVPAAVASHDLPTLEQAIRDTEKQWAAPATGDASK